MVAYYVKRNFMVSKTHVVFSATGFLNREIRTGAESRMIQFVRNMTLHRWMSGSRRLEGTCCFRDVGVWSPKSHYSVQHIVCCCEALALQRYKVLGRLTADPKDISTASVRDLCLFIRSTGLMNLC